MSIQPIPMPSRVQDITGRKFGKLTVVAYAGMNRHNNTAWHVVCDCGNARVVVGSKLKSGTTKTCTMCVASLPEDEYREFVKGKLLSRITKVESGCWEWNGTRCTRGYGSIWCWNKAHQSHRVSYLVFNGEFDRSLLVCHKCDNPPCCNPEHLFLGTSKDNVQDMISKGRHNFQGRARRVMTPTWNLTDEQIAQIRQMLAPNPHTVASVAAMFGISRYAVRVILSADLQSSDQEQFKPQECGEEDYEKQEAEAEAN